MDSDTSSQLIKRCRVCGDQAICFNFDVLTCGPCRLFFYRNVQKTKVWKCPTNGNCEVGINNRKYCRRCRMQKCFAIGMKPKLMTKSQCTSNDQQLIDEKSEISLRGVLEEGETTNYCLSESKITLPKCMSMNHFEFNLTEVKYIDELLNSTAAIFDFEENKLPVLYEETNFYKTFNLGMYYVRRIIKFCKSNSVFRALNDQDQLQVLKNFITEVLMIRYSFAYDPRVGGYYAIANEEGNGSVFSTMTNFYQLSQSVSNDLVDKKKKNSQLLYAEMDNDTTIRDLLIVQALFDSTENVSSAESLRYHYWIYNHLLLRYLQCKYRNMEKAQNKYSTLIRVMASLREGRKVFHKVIVTLDRDQFGDLAAEILNLT